MWNKQKHCGQLQNHVWIANFCGGIGKITILPKYSCFFMVLWHGGSCKEVCGTINPIRDRSGRPGITHDVISVQACSSEESKSLNVEQTHDKSGQPDKHIVAAQNDPEVIMRPKRSTLTMRQFVKELRQTWTSKFQDCHILLWSMRKAPAFKNWFRKLRTTQIDMLFNKIHDRINHLIFSVQNQNTWFMRQPRAQCKVCLSCWNIGVVCCTCGHFLRKGREENQKFIKYTMDLLSIPDCVTKKGRAHGHWYGRKPGNTEWPLHRQPAEQEVQKKFFQGIHDRFIRDEQFRKRMIENDRDEGVCRQMDDLANENTHHLTPQEDYRCKSDWWIRLNKTGSDTVPVKHGPDFKQALSSLQQLKEKEAGGQRNQQWAQSSSSSSWWSWQGSWWTPYSYESPHGDEPSTDWTSRFVVQVFGTILQGMIFLNSSTLLQMDRLQLTAVCCNRRGV